MRISDWSSDVCSSDLWFPEPSQTTSAIVDRHASPFQTEGAVLEGLKRPVFAREQFGSPERFVSVARRREIGRASCRARVCQYVSISVVAVYLKQKTNTIYRLSTTKQTHNKYK